MLEQVVLPFGPKPLRADVPDETLVKQRDMLGAINLAAAESGLNNEAIYPVLGIEKAAFSKSMSGSNHFPANSLDKFCDAVGNEIVLRWWAQKRGYKLVKLKSTLEEENELLRLEVADLKRDKQTILEFAKSLK
ncbi:hypothetical protein LCGC14_1236390 [marine sediment metagenome]|uniref:Uncharacterized protein n=1 Tax=marine sediment metagenome TaxID=412755 RepID=A0A0F9L765_9ZZZZ